MPCAPQWIDTCALLARVPMFAGLRVPELARLAAATREIHAVRGDMLFRKDEPCNGLFLVVYGRVKLVFTSSQGCEKILEILDQGDTFCESTMLLGHPYPVYAQTLTECLLLHISKTAILAELEQGPALARGIIERMAKRLSGLTADIESYSLHTGRQRVVHYLLREVDGSNCDFARGENSPCVTLPTHKSVIASRLNLTQEHFSRILHDLAAGGLLAVDGREILIPDLGGLRRTIA